MAVKIFSWPSLNERMSRTWGSNSGPFAWQADMLLIELPCQAIKEYGSMPLFSFRKYLVEFISYALIKQIFIKRKKVKNMKYNFSTKSRNTGNTVSYLDIEKDSSPLAMLLVCDTAGSYEDISSAYTQQMCCRRYNSYTCLHRRGSLIRVGIFGHCKYSLKWDTSKPRKDIQHKNY